LAQSCATPDRCGWSASSAWPLGYHKRKVQTLRKLVRDDEEAQDGGEEAREDETDPEGEAADGGAEREEQADPDGEERSIGNPFAKSEFDFDDPGKPGDSDTEQ
jgi:hypothetical protein